MCGGSCNDPGERRQGLEQGGNSNEKWLYSRYILKVGAPDFLMGLYGVLEKERDQNSSLDFLM